MPTFQSVWPDLFSDASPSSKVISSDLLHAVSCPNSQSNSHTLFPPREADCTPIADFCFG
jgi:hypothetical protein